ncbi:aKG-HExxH-type peptide beta-hydroxylase [Nocardiopsis ansamitocini]|uniref:HEXXH motif-containing protein n=1 Tax=Nocardiopsis ansamitocini TaxID=1670832 RepID=A0A9W6P6B6_9ACTN|nr:HEXXH motif-containing putative peptide modification protein [Nocardiopsis ansamitocini]GLU47874.1 hypothetical protein Nans01_22250 [Nocardiopsis ansamitocini]
MRVAPEAQSAERDEQHLARLVRGRLTELIGPDSVPPASALRHPAFHSLAHAAQRAARRGDVNAGVRGRFTAETAAAATRVVATAFTEKVHDLWQVGLPGPERHLTASVRRAAAQVAAVPGRTTTADEVVIGAWNDDRRAALRASCRLLGAAWPEMLAELAVVLRQIALLDGHGLEGFTDFTVHGVVFVNSERLEDAQDGLPGSVRFAEALVHEGTHNRCNAAAVAEPFLLPDSGASPLVQTPLRADPRPLSGLFQQVIVLARSMEFYDRALRAGANGDAVRERRAVLAEQGRKGVVTMRAHADSITVHGHSMVEEAAALLERSA